MLLRQVADDVLAQYTYLIGCQRTGEAIVIDPERDVDRYVAMAEAEDLRITAVTETHIHADFVSGARELAARGAHLYLSAEGGPDWQYTWPAETGTAVTWLRDGDAIRVGQIELRVVHTPGHTPEHLAFLVTDHGGGADVPMGLASGDFLFVGDVGRPDLLESAAGQVGVMRPSAERLGVSLRALAGQDDALQIWPGHGAGSACGKALGAVPMSTLGYERRFNGALRLAIDAPARFPDVILEGQPEPPLYFAAMKQINKAGPPLIGGLPQPVALSAQALANAAGQPGTLVVDTRRDRTAFMRGHLPGALFAPLDRTFPTVLGSLARLEDRLLLVVAQAELDTAVRECIRIGFDRIAGWAPPETVSDLPASTLTSIPTTDFPSLVGGSGRQVLDVRSAREFAEDHLPGAINIPHTRLLTRLGDLPRDRPITVHCARGARAAGAASALAREGFEVVYVNDLWAGSRPGDTGEDQSRGQG